MNIPRGCKTVNTPSALPFRVVLGWECQRPFIALDRMVNPYDDEPEYRTWERRADMGGCRDPKGPGCEFECAGCRAADGAIETAYLDNPGNDDEAFIDAVWADADALRDTIGHDKWCPPAVASHDMVITTCL